MSIKGLTTLSLVDWNGVVCATVFVGGCNFRCPWCQNAPLVLNPEKLKTIHYNEILQDIEGLGKYIDGVCITGGEPTLYADLDVFASKLKHLGLKVKLDTNGSNNGYLEYLIDLHLVDYIAMDIKAPLTIEKYSQYTGVKVDEITLSNIMMSIDKIKTNNVDYEFRTTVVPGLHTVKDIEQIAKYAIKSSKKYVIQNFWNAGELINKRYANLQPFSIAELENFANAAKPYVKEVKIRNLSQNV